MHDDIEKAAFEAAVDLHFEMIVKLVIAELDIPWDDACHWVEEAIVNAWHAYVRGSIPKPVGSWCGYLLSAATRMAKRALGRAAKEGHPRDVSLNTLMDEYGFDAEAPSPDDGTMLLRLQSALAALTPRQREAVELFYYQNLSHKEMAERLGITPEYSEVLLSRALARLRCLLIDLREAA